MRIASRELSALPYFTRLIVVVGEMSAWEVYDHVATEYKAEVRSTVKAGGGAGFMAASRQNNTVVLWLRGWHADVIVHEAFHATREIMRQAGMRRLTGSNEEAWAYLLGRIVDQIVGMK